MGHSKALAALALVLPLGLVASGCASLRWSLTKALRSPGIQLESLPEQVWQDYDCANQHRPFFIMEKNELVPPRVRPASEFDHRMVYAMCPRRPTEVVSGQLSTRIRFKGAAIVDDTVPDYELRPGRWTVDSFVTLPGNAEPGVYAYEIQFQSPTVHFDERLTFIVDEP